MSVTYCAIKTLCQKHIMRCVEAIARDEGHLLVAHCVTNTNHDYLGSMKGCRLKSTTDFVSFFASISTINLEQATFSGSAHISPKQDPT